MPGYGYVEAAVGHTLQRGKERDIEGLGLGLGLGEGDEGAKESKAATGAGGFQRGTVLYEDSTCHAKPDLGDPVGMTLKRGDAFFCTSKLALSFGLNHTDRTTGLVLFRYVRVEL